MNSLIALSRFILFTFIFYVLLLSESEAQKQVVNFHNSDESISSKVQQSKEISTPTLLQNLLCCENSDWTDSDSDGVTNECDLDKDNDGVTDEVECPAQELFAVLLSPVSFMTIDVTDIQPGDKFTGGFDLATQSPATFEFNNKSYEFLIEVTSVSNATVALGSSGNLDIINSIPSEDPYFTYKSSLVEQGSVTASNPNGIALPLEDFFVRMLNIDGDDPKDYVDIAGQADSNQSERTILGSGLEFLPFSGGNPAGFSETWRPPGPLAPNGASNPLDEAWASDTYFSASVTENEFLYGLTGDYNEVVSVRGFGMSYSSVRACDTDGDGTIDHLDTDSDNDDCPDAIEGDAGLAPDQIDENNMVIGDVDACSGVPELVGTGQNVGGGQDENVQNDNCQLLLPISLVDFTAAVEGLGMVRLQWQMRSSDHIDYFELQRSYDLSSWQKIAELKANDHGDSLSEYNYLDDPSKEHLSGQVHYKLVAINKDGSSDYSHIVVVTLDSENGYSIYPNIASVGDEITIKGKSVNNVKIYSSAGKLIHNQNYNSDNKVGIELPMRNAGVYTLVINDKITKRIIIR